LNTDIDRYESEGYVVLPRLIGGDEVAHYRNELENLSGFSDDEYPKVYKLVDGVTRTPAFWPLIFDERIVAAVRQAIGSDTRYLFHSDVRINMVNCGWHRDGVSKAFGTGTDWEEEVSRYRILRVGVFLHDFDKNQSTFGVIAGSHRRDSSLPEKEMRMQERIRQRVKRNFNIPLFTRRPTWLPTEAGTCILFDQRLLHSASPIRWAKHSLFYAYGGEDFHSTEHRKHFVEGRTFYQLNGDNQTKDQFEACPRELAEQLKDAGLWFEGDESSAAIGASADVDLP